MPSTPSAAPSLRMLRPSTPSRSTISNAARTICSLVSAMRAIAERVYAVKLGVYGVNEQGTQGERASVARGDFYEPTQSGERCTHWRRDGQAMGDCGDCGESASPR